MAYLSENEMQSLGFKSLGKHVKISNKASIYNANEIEIGDHSRIDDFCILSGKIYIGRNVHITPMCLIAGGQPGIYLEDFSTLAYGVKVLSQTDDYLGFAMVNSTIPVEYKNEYKKEVYIRKHVIIGTSTVVLPGVDLAEGCSVGAMSLVIKSIPIQPWSVLAGIPARKIKDRQKDLLKKEAQYLLTFG